MNPQIAPQTPPQAAQTPTLSPTFAGTLEAWRTGVAAPAVGNPMLAVALCAAFAAPLVNLFEDCCGESFGVCLVAPSSTGKTALLALAASVWSASVCDPELFTSGLLVVDEAAGGDKGEALNPAQDLPGCLLLGADERPAAHWQNLPALRTHGVFDELHGHANACALATALMSAAKASHSHAGPVFLAALAMHPQDLRAKLQTFKNLPEFISASTPEVQAQGHKARATPSALRREAHRFALLALAGELASAWGLTGWPQGEAVRACATALRACQAGAATQGARHA